MKITKKSIQNCIASLLRGTGMLMTAFGLLTIATGTLTSCSETELATAPTNEAWQNDPDALCISATVGGAFGSNGATTRTNPMGDVTVDTDDEQIKGDQTAFNPGDKIGVYTNDQDKVIYTLSADGTTWTPEEGKYLKWTSNTMQVYAYYPLTTYLDFDGSTVENDAQNFTLPTGQRGPESIAAADYMTFNGIATRPKDGSANLSLPMQRRTARVIINITSAGDEIDLENDVIEFPKIRSPYRTYTNNVASTDNDAGRNVDSYADRKGVNGFNAKSATRFTTLVIPATEDKTISYAPWLTILVKDKNNSYKSFYVNTIPAMDPGKSYTYNLKLGKDKVTIEGITVQDWSTGAPLPGGEATIEPWDISAVDFDSEDINTLIASHVYNGKLKLVGSFGSSTDETQKKFAKIADYIRSHASGSDAVTALDFSETTGVVEIGTYNSTYEAPFINSALVTVNLPATITKLYGFAGCAALTTVTGGGDGIYVDQNTFSRCTALTTVPTTFTTIGTFAFSGCTALTKVECPKATYLGNEIFNGCTSLTDIYLTAETFSFVRSYTWNGDYYSSLTGIKNLGSVTLHLNGNQAGNISGISDGKPAWSPVAVKTSDKDTGMEQPVDLSGFGAVYCGTEQVYPAK